MIRVGLIGAGGIARRHIEALKTIDGVRISAIYDVARERAEAAAASCGAIVCSDQRQCIDACDAVYIATPPSFHREQVLMALDAGRHVFCEKPLAASLEDGLAIAEAAHRSNKQVAVGFNMRLRKGGMLLRDLHRSGELGHVYNFWIHRMGPGIGPTYNWRTDPQLLCGVAVESVSHDIDMVRWICGEIKDVRATVYASRADLPAYDTDVNVAMTLASGDMALIHVSWASPLGHNARGLIGTVGSAMLDGPMMWDWQSLHVKTTAMPYEQVTVINDMLASSDSYLNQTRRFIESVQTGVDVPASVDDGLKALEVSHAILRSAREGCVVTVGGAHA